MVGKGRGELEGGSRAGRMNQQIGDRKEHLRRLSWKTVLENTIILLNRYPQYPSTSTIQEIPQHPTLQHTPQNPSMETPTPLDRHSWMRHATSNPSDFNMQTLLLTVSAGGGESMLVPIDLIHS